MVSCFSREGTTLFYLIRAARAGFFFAAIERSMREGAKLFVLFTNSDKDYYFMDFRVKYSRNGYQRPDP